ncbi:MAG: hypothetical protein NXH73_02205 [Flavobacteriaceae bacterium]|nr:hypothetical protein [Flavobacteriaceae bacterium]
MKLNYFIILKLVFFSSVLYPQVGINTTNPSSGAILDINSTDKGILIPRVEIMDVYDNFTPVENPTYGLMVFNTNNLSGRGEGFYYWNGSQWTMIGSDIPIFSISNKDILSITIPNTPNFNNISDNIISDMKLEFTAYKSSVLLILSASGNSDFQTMGEVYFIATKTLENGSPIMPSPEILGGSASQIGGFYSDGSIGYSNNRWNCDLTIMVDNLTIGSTYTFEIAARASVPLGNENGIKILNSKPENHLTLSVIH